MKKSYLSPKVELRKSKKGGKGLFAKERIKKGELVIDYTTGPGKFVNNKVAHKLFMKGHDYGLRVDNDLFWAAIGKKQLEPADFLNHSCNPNCGIKGKLKIVAMRDIKPGEEITFDYAMAESSKYKITCKCKSKYCRGIITGDDWRLPKLQKKYHGFFSDYLKRKLF